ncbi:OmpA family protein [Aureispira anguillae]|uniref:OmpA family protein n=1 Tax=Aureispira anguillae TaxID=2864201 RepID=A0A916DX46_9BACT|nr:OmpA family protein [Aureispira anguillae]BDS15385.1 OmpA family protein [Aureispira anguillae]
MKYIVLIFSLVYCWQSVLGQKGNTGKAERYYNELGYAQYIKLKGGGDWSKYDRATLTKLGTSYRKVGDFKNAEKVYRSLIEQEDDTPLNHLYYAQALQANGYYFKAGEAYKICHERMKANKETAAAQRALAGYQACNQISVFKAKGKVSIRNVKELNTPNLDFSPMYYKDGLVFVSTRKMASLEKVDQWLNENCMDLYYAPLVGEQFETPKSFSDQLNTRLHEGPVSFSDDAQKVFFTRNNYQNGKRGKSKDRITKLKIYSAKLKKGLWKEVTELPFNDDDIDVCHPALSADERVMVFASSEGENSQGGMDLYASYWVGNNWTTPVNLGPKINTAGDEVFPYIHPDGMLYFSSTGHGGLGGLDLFMAMSTGDDEKKTWVFPLNLGMPFNSKHDDFGFILNKEGSEGYLTSNRLGGQGKDDIYHFELEKGGASAVKPKPLMPLEICVYDKADHARIEGATVSIRKANAANLSKEARERIGITDGKNIILSLTPVREGANEYTIQLNSPNTESLGILQEPEQIYTTNDEGTFLYSLYASEEYVFEVKKDGYIVVQEYFLMPPDGELEEFCIGILKRSDAIANSLKGNNWTTPKTDDSANGTAGNLPSATTDKNNNSPTYNLDPSLLVGPDGKPLPANQPYVAGVVLNKEYNRPLLRTKVTLLDRCTGEESVVLVNKTGTFAFPLECGCDYVLKARKDNFIGDNKVLSLVKVEDCKPITTELLMTPGFDKLGAPIVIAGQTITESLKEGDIIQMRDIFYDFDKYDIRDDASPDLDRLAGLMQQFKSMKIELSSHTDSRGTKEYNEALSSSRAKSAKEYLVRKGIEEDRIKTIGYGEKRPQNNCKDGVDCSEFEHQRNRRTEVLITDFDQAEYIKVYYEDNKPVKVDPKRN